MQNFPDKCNSKTNLFETKYISFNFKKRKFCSRHCVFVILKYYFGIDPLLEIISDYRGGGGVNS